MPQEPPTPQPNQEPKDEKLEFLKREEVRTMAKDIAKVREQQARNEREHIAELKKHRERKPEINKPEVVLVQQPSERKPEQKPGLLQEKTPEVKPGAMFHGSAGAKQFAPAPKPPEQKPELKPAVPPQKQEVPRPEAEPGAMFHGSAGAPPALGTFKRLRGSYAESARPSQAVGSDPARAKQFARAPKQKRPLTRFEKIFIRLVIVNIILFMVFNILAFGFWYFFKRDGMPQPPSQDTQQQTPVLPSPPAPKPQSPAVKPPVAFFQAAQHELLLKTRQELLGNLQNFLSGNLAPGFLHLTLKAQGTTASLQQFLEGAAIGIPQELQEKLGDVMLFSFVAKEKKRLGFIAELKSLQGVSVLLRSWESAMEQDMDSFFALIASKGPRYTPFFRSTSYRDISVRFQTFSVIDFGIVYGIVGDKLLLTSSLESFLRTADQLLLQQP